MMQLQQHHSHFGFEIKAAFVESVHDLELARDVDLWGSMAQGHNIFRRLRHQ
jgi:hypothetical protein